MMVSRAHTEQKELNGRMLISILQNVQFLGRQGLALRGHEDNESNFIQLMKLRSHDQQVRISLICLVLHSYQTVSMLCNLGPMLNNKLMYIIICRVLLSGIVRRLIYTLVPEIQNEVIELMSHTILRELIKEVQQVEYLQSRSMNVLIHQITSIWLCASGVDTNLVVHDDFIELYRCPDIKANTIVSSVE